MHAAIDLGAGSGRSFLGRVTSTGIELTEVHRFHYGPRHADRHLRWDVPKLYDGLVAGLQAARAAADAAGGVLTTCGVDSWGVDYGLFHATGRLLEEPIAYRDPRTEGVMEAVFARVPRERIFAQTGIQFLPFNTVYQLAAHVRDGLPSGASRLLMIPDLCHHFLCGARTGEYTNATTTQLLNARTRKWDDELFLQLGLPRALMPPVAQPGTELGTLRAARQAEVGGPTIRVIAPATHDTASAVVGTPLERGWAYVSSGTWSLVGVELSAPRLDAAVAAANFTNEGGAFGTVRFLRNVMGLWLLEACRKEWGAEAPGIDALIADAAARPRPAGVIDPDDRRFLNPRSMTEAIRHRLMSTGQDAPEDPAAFARVIFDSLALRYAAVVSTIERLTGEPIPGVHVVGGGSRNTYLNQATANATGRPVVAGPVEATAAGNVLVQAIAAGELASLTEGRAQLARSVSLRRFEPQHQDGRWTELAALQASLTSD